MAAAGTYVNAHPDRRRAVPEADRQPLRLLIVDDDDHYRAYLAVLTRRLGFEVDMAPDGAAALECLAHHAYDVAIVDQQMPRMTGIETIARIRADESTKALYVLMLTAREDLETKLTALDAGFDDFVTKTALEEELVAKLTAGGRIAARQRTMDVAIRELYGLATRDELTGVFNRRFFIAETERLLAAGTAINIVLFDLDGFKLVNDTYGHLAGDRVLRDIGALFHRNTRPEDIAARFGGDEFVLAIPQLDIGSTERIATRLVAEITALEWAAGESRFRVGVSSGVASSRLLTAPSLPQLFNAADRDLYKNKWVRKHPELRPELYVYPDSGPGVDRLRL
jgi:two-component system cell cycle response regulator